MIAYQVRQMCKPKKQYGTGRIYSKKFDKMHITNINRIINGGVSPRARVELMNRKKRIQKRMSIGKYV